MKPYLFLATLTILSGMLATVGLCQDNAAAVSDADREEDAAIAAEWAKIAKTQNAEMVFHGVVKDEQGKPMSDATVDVCIRRLDAVKMLKDNDLSVITDAHGKFRAEGKGVSVIIVNIQKPGYAFEMEPPERMFRRQPAPNSGERPFPTADTPAEFILRKIEVGKTGHLLEGEGWFKLNLFADREGMAFLGKSRGDGSPPKNMYQKLPESWPTLRVRLEPTNDPGKWDLVCSGGNADDQFFLSPRKLRHLDMTQEHPFQPEVRIPTEVGGNDLTTWLIMRTVKPSTISSIELYVRMPLESDAEQKRYLPITYTSLTNPYGDPVLEESKALRAAWPLKRHLDGLAWAALMKGMNPVRPDLTDMPKLIAEFEAMMTEKERKRQERINRFKNK